MIASGDPLVSICIPTYRGARFLPATITSILSQSYANFEVWIVDDASPDNTVEVVETFHDERIRLIRNPRNLGPEGNWNRCLEIATGKYYKLMPQDDLLAPDSLAEHVAILEADRDEEIALVFGSRSVIDHRDRTYFTRRLSGARAGRMSGKKLIRRCVRAGSNLIGEPGNGLIRRSVVQRVGRYDTVHPYLVDLDYWFRVLALGDAYYTDKRSSSFRVSQGSWSVALGNKQYQDFKDFVDKFAADTNFGISRGDKRLGFAMARINTIGRAFIYQLLFKGNS